MFDAVRSWRVVPIVAVVLASMMTSSAAELVVENLSPTRHTTAAADTYVSVTFDRAIDLATVDSSSFRVFGRSSGTATGTYFLSHSGRTVTFAPSQPFFAGEAVLVNLANTIASTDGTSLRSAGFAFRFVIAADPAQRDYERIDTMSVDDGPDPRIYGALASDFDNDGWIDLGVVNESTSDIRVFINRADGTGLFFDFLTPPTGVGSTPSPNEPADFDNDGNIDACTANFGGTFSVVLGQGDGTFSASQEVSIGGDARGIAVLDVDGDADLDVAVTNGATDAISVSINDGAGTFDSISSFDANMASERSLAAGDMNEDGITDLVVGSASTGDIAVALGQGDGTFTMGPVQATGVPTWMIVLGDVNGDGHLDVTVANGMQNQASILLGAGDGSLGAASFLNMAGHTVATDVGDVDGDGDQDWILSSYGGRHWQIYLNDGAANFTFDQQFEAIANPACAVVLDFDHDGDLDLSLLDEISNDIMDMANSTVPSDSDGDGVLDAEDCAPADATAWTVPAEVMNLTLRSTGNSTLLSWNYPAVLGAESIRFDTLRATRPDDFSSATCVENGGTRDTLYADAAVPTSAFFYLVRAINDCGPGTAGTASTRAERIVATCP